MTIGGITSLSGARDGGTSEATFSDDKQSPASEPADASPPKWSEVCDFKRRPFLSRRQLVQVPGRTFLVLDSRRGYHGTWTVLLRIHDPALSCSCTGSCHSRGREDIRLCSRAGGRRSMGLARWMAGPVSEIPDTDVRRSGRLGRVGRKQQYPVILAGNSDGMSETRRPQLHLQWNGNLSVIR